MPEGSENFHELLREKLYPIIAYLAKFSFVLNGN